MHGDHRSYRLTQIAFPIFLCTYVSIALWRERIPGQGEIFPIAPWSLFTLVPNVSSSYALRVLEFDGTRLEPARYFEQAPDLFGASGGHAAHVVIDRLGKAIAAGDDAEVAAIRAKLEAQYLREARRIRYELVVRVQDPLERMRTGRFKQVRTISTFEREFDDVPTNDKSLASHPRRATTTGKAFGHLGSATP